MQTIRCPDCKRVIQQSAHITDRQFEIGLNQLSNHMTLAHLLPDLEEMLQLAAMDDSCCYCGEDLGSLKESLLVSGPCGSYFHAHDRCPHE